MKPALSVVPPLVVLPPVSAYDPVEAPAAFQEKVNILLVDDRADKLLSLQVILGELGENLVLVNSGREALRELLKRDYAVILLDVNMPGMDGFETAAMIRQRERSETTAIIFFSAINDTDNHVSRGYSLGAVDYILTPVVPEILRAKVAVFVDLYRKSELLKRQVDERAEFIREQAARAEAEAARERLAFLAEASNVLAGSLDYQETFNSLARLVVPKLADFCIIDVADADGTLRQVAVAHRDPALEVTLREMAADYPKSLSAKHGGTRVFQTGKPELVDSVSDEMIDEMFEREEDRARVRSLDIRGYIAVPLRARDRTLGAITMVNTTATRPCGPNELWIAEELAQRAALALDNAGLYYAAQQARLDAERANLAKDRFLAMLSHELRTPLTPVLTCVMGMQGDDSLPDSLRDPLEMVRRNVELEARLIDDLLDLTRISKGKVQLSLETVDAHALLHCALEICRSDIEAKQLAVELDLAAVRFHLRADAARLQQIFWNLIKNAVKFTARGGSLKISSHNEEDALLCVQVADNGIGIAAELLPKIFDAFQQGETPRTGGLGLGLAITRALVGLHHGHIVATSPGPGCGTTLTLHFPTCEAESADEPITPVPASGGRKPLRILLVEDHEDTNRSLTQLLHRRGYEVRSEFNVASALAAAQEYRFDVLVSDMGLPDGTGLDLIRQLAANHPLFGIALSGYGMEDDIRESHLAGFQHHLIKPVDINKLDDLIQQAPVEV